MTICILGRQPEIGLAELESLYGSAAVRALGENCALVDATVDFARLGSTVKAATLLDTVPGTNIHPAIKKVVQHLPKIVQSLPSGKIKLGMSLYGFTMSPYAISGETLRLKKLLTRGGRSVRAVPNDTPALSSAQTFHNSLAGELGIEIVLVADADKIYIGRVTHVQNIDAYRTRDRERPKRDAFVGMLPPKLAQTIVNLAIGEWKMEDSTVLDPFCGTGVILQEALLMGYNAFGTDKAAKMIDYSKANLEWLDTKYDLSTTKHELAIADATSYKWNFSKIQNPKSKIFIACEGYLGQPIGGQQPTEIKMQEIVHDTNTTMRGFLKNIATQLKPGTRLCVAMPAWYIGSKVYRLPVLDELEKLGYSRVEFAHAPGNLIYRREDQATARELVVLVQL